MTNHTQDTLALARHTPDIDVGRPVEWMLDPDQPEIILGVTYAFSLTGERKTVWYTANRRRAKTAIMVTDLGPPMSL